MAKSKDVGVSQKSNGYWEYRFVMIVNGKTINRRKSTDADGNKLKTRTEAIKAREAAMVAARQEKKKERIIVRKTVREVYEEYQEKGRKGKAYKTKLKQDSLWKNHFCEKWGKRYVDEISVAEINDFLAELYYEYIYFTKIFLKNQKTENETRLTEITIINRLPFLLFSFFILFLLSFFSWRDLFLYLSLFLT